MEDLKPYPKYKNSEYDWLGEVPLHWEERYLFQCATEQNLSNKTIQHQNLLSLSYGRIKRKDIKTTTGLLPATFDNYQIVNKGNIILRLTDLQNDHKSLRTGLVTETGIITSAYLCLKCTEDTIAEFLQQLLHSYDIRKLFYGLGGGLRQSCGFQDLKKIRIYLPPLSEQIQIANYLDYKVALINKFIKDKKKEIILLKEQKQAEINQAVTRGVNPNAKMKDSGISWIGEIPEHWEIMHLRGLLKMTSVKNMAHLPLLSVVREKGVIVRDLVNDKNHNFVPDDLSGYKAVKKGDFVINKMKAWQGSCGVSNFDGIVSPAYYTFELDFENKDYFNLAIRSKIYVNFFTQFSGGIRVGQWDLSAQKLKSISFFVPPAKEQIEIEEYLKTKTEQINRAITAIENEIALLQDYKISLISNVVTGKVDVRNIAVENTKEEPEEDLEDVEEMENSEDIENSEE